MSNAELTDAVVGSELYDSVYRFINHEAALADASRLEEWYELWEPECVYWVPVNSDAEYELGRTLSLIRDDHHRIGERISRLQNPAMHSQVPPSRTCRLVGNVVVSRVGDSDDEVVAVSRVMIDEVRRGLQELYSGVVEHRLRRREDGQWGIVEKTVRLTRSNDALGNLTFLL